MKFEGLGEHVEEERKEKRATRGISPNSDLHRLTTVPPS